MGPSAMFNCCFHYNVGNLARGNGAQLICTRILFPVHFSRIGLAARFTDNAVPRQAPMLGARTNNKQQLKMNIYEVHISIILVQ